MLTIGMMAMLLAGQEASENPSFDLQQDEVQYWGNFELQAGRTYLAETFELTEGCDTILRLYRWVDPQNSEEVVLVAENDDVDYAAGNLASRIEWACDQDGQYYLEIARYGANSGGTGRIRFDDVTASPEAAALDRFNVDLAANLHYGDVELVEGTTYEFVIEGASEGFDPAMSLRRSTDPTQAFESDPVVTTTESGTLRWTCDAGGAYYMTLRSEAADGTATLVVREVR